MVKLLFFVHTITELCNRQGGARAVDFSARSFDLVRPGVAPPLFLRSFPLEIEDQPRVWGEVTHFVPRRTTAFFNKLHVPDSVRSSQFMVF